MPTKSKKQTSPAQMRAANEKAAMLEKPELGHLQAIVTKTLDDLGADAYGHGAIEALVERTETWVDPSPIYTTIRHLLQKGYLGKPELRQSEDGGPPMKIYKLTAEGRAVLQAAAAHYRAVADYLDGRGRERKPTARP